VNSDNSAKVCGFNFYQSSVMHPADTIFLPDNTDLICSPNKPAKYLAIREQVDL